MCKIRKICGRKSEHRRQECKKIGENFSFCFSLSKFLSFREARVQCVSLDQAQQIPLILLKSPGLFPTPSPDVRTVRQFDKRCITVSIFLVILSCTDSPTNIFKIKSTTYSTYNMLIFNCSRYIQRFSC